MNKCPQCGYVEVPVPDKTHHVMNHYVTKDGKRQVYMNHRDEKLSLVTGEADKKVTTEWIRKDVYDKEQAAAKAAAEAAAVAAKTPPAK